MPVIIKFGQYYFSNTGTIKATDNAAFTFIQGSQSFLNLQLNQTAAHYAAANRVAGGI